MKNNVISEIVNKSSELPHSSSDIIGDLWLSGITSIWEKLKNEERPIVLYGTGNGADRIIDILEKENIKISGVFSSAAFVRDRFFRGYKVTDFEACKKEYPDMLVLMCFGSAREDVINNVKKIAEENEILAPDVPVFGENVFDDDFFNIHKCELLEVRSRLADEKSVETFDKLVEFKLTGNISNLFSCEYDSKEIFNITEKSVFLDLGAYNGDTATAFAKEYAYERIIAVEPDKRNFRKLSENTAGIQNITLYNALISDKNETVYLNNNKGRGAHESEKGKIPVDALTIDTIIRKEELPENGQLVIKFDVEGNELKAIEGGKNTIKEKTPLMFISCYHRSEDYFAIPLKVFEINDNYELYIRHYKGIPAWETEYIFAPKIII